MRDLVLSVGKYENHLDPHASISWIFFQNTFKRVTLRLFVLLSLSNENCRIHFRAENRIFLERASIWKWGIGYRPKAIQHLASTSYTLTVPRSCAVVSLSATSLLVRLRPENLPLIFTHPFPPAGRIRAGTASILPPHWCGFACMFWITLKYTTGVLKSKQNEKQPER